MPIRSQLDTSMYRGMGSSGTTIGDMLNAVNTISSLTGTIRERKKQNQEDEDLTYVNGVIGKYMQGYDGQDANDLYQRKQGAYNEIMTTRPELSKYVTPKQDADFKGLQDYRKNDLALQSSQVALDNDKETLKASQFTNKQNDWKQKIERSMEAAQKLSEVQDEFGYGKVLQDYGDVLGEIDPYYQNYLTSQNPATVFWRNKAGQIKEQKLAEATKAAEDRDLLVREKEAGIGNKKADTSYKGAQIRGIDSEIKKRQWDMDNPKTDPANNRFGHLTGFNAPETLANAGMALGHFTALKGYVDSGEAKWWERGRGGKFLNPEFKGSFDYLANYVGRKDSGAAINKDEWVTFRNLVADQDMMMTEAGRAQVSRMLGKFIGSVYAQGVLQTKGNENWYDDYLELEKYANTKYGPSSTQIQPSATDDLQLIRQRRAAMQNGR